MKPCPVWRIHCQFNVLLHDPIYGIHYIMPLKQAKILVPFAMYRI